MVSYWRRRYPYTNMTGVLIKWGNLDTDTPTGRMWCKHIWGEIRDPGDASTSQGMPKVATKPQEARDRHRNLLHFKDI